MTHRVEILRRAAKALGRLPSPDFERVRTAIGALAHDPRPPGCKKLVGREGWRVRVGRYRVLYEVSDVVRIVTVVDGGNRKDVYE